MRVAIWRTLFAQRCSIVVNVGSTFVSCQTEAPEERWSGGRGDGGGGLTCQRIRSYRSRHSPTNEWRLPRHLSHTTDSADSTFISCLISVGSYAQEVKSNSISCQQPRCLANKNLGSMGEENMIVTPLALGDIAHNVTVAVKTECSQRREFTRRCVLHTQRYRLTNQDVRMAVVLSVFTLHPKLELKGD